VPLLDHFHPPLSVERPWDGIHSAWATIIATQLNQGLLPPDYFAMPQLTFGGRLEIDVATFAQPVEQTPEEAANGAVATAVWAPPRAALTAPVDFTHLDVFEVRIMQQLGGPQLRAAIELVSPANKDRASHRLAFAVKCAAYLQRGVSVIVVDVVTERRANLHAELIQLLHLEKELTWQSPSELYATAYRVARTAEQDRVEAWLQPLAVGAVLPTLPLWLTEDLCLPLHLEESYLATCASLRILV
jgi:Protein of unknown function (DUF4058)